MRPIDWADAKGSFKGREMQTVTLKIVDSVATIVMDRSKSRNALNGQLVADLQQAFSDVHQEKRVRAVVLTGAGDSFCSGVDLKSFAEILDLDEMESAQAWIEAWRQLTELCEALLRFPKPVVAAVDGAAVGAGLAVALACDLLVASDRAELVANAAERGLVGGVTAPLLSFRFGTSIASRMLLTGSAVSAEEALRLGMCCEVVAPSQVWVAANEWAKRCGNAPRESLQATKRMLNETIGEQLMIQLANGAAAGATICSTESAAEGMRAFTEARQPDWPG
ncbi:MAG: enoyl-CoA hydratase/isomerase family protein [Planctomycetota bacterium]